MDTLEKIRDFFDTIGIHIALIIAGAFGVLLSLEDRQRLTAWEKIGIFLSGAATSNYLTPPIVYWTGVNDSVKFGLGFLLGFAGLKGVKLIVIYIKKRFFHKED